MNETMLIRFGDRYHLRIKGEWHKYRCWEEVRLLCLHSGYDPWTVLASAITLTDPVELEYRPDGRHKWFVNGRPQPVNIVRGMLREVGCNKEVIDAILHAEKLVYRIRELAQC